MYCSIKVTTVLYTIQLLLLVYLYWSVPVNDVTRQQTYLSYLLSRFINTVFFFICTSCIVYWWGCPLCYVQHLCGMCCLDSHVQYPLSLYVPIDFPYRIACSYLDDKLAYYLHHPHLSSPYFTKLRPTLV